MDEIRLITPSELNSVPGAVLIDVREPGEFAGDRLTGSVNIPLSRFEAEAVSLPRGRPVVLVCQSGRRSLEGAHRLAAMGFTDVRVLESGLSGVIGHAMEKGPGGGWAMERQVRMAAGSLVLTGAAVGHFLHPAGWLLSAGVGAGLVFSAATDTCTMARVLARMPWNRG